MDSEHLKIFQKIVEMGSISKAARSLNYVQSSVTTKIKQLEDELGVLLFYRNNKGITLTSEGKDFNEYANKILYMMSEAKEAIRPSEHILPLNIGAVDTTAATKMPLLMSSFHKHHPNIELNLDVAGTEKLIQQVINNNLQGAFVDGPVSNAQIVTELSYYERIGFVSTRYKNLDEMNNRENAPFFMLNPNCIYALKINQYFSLSGIRPARFLRRGSLESIIDSVRHEGGVAVLPISYYQKIKTDDLFFVTIPGDEGRALTTFIRKKDEYPTLSMKTFLNELHHHLLPELRETKSNFTK